MKNSKLLIIMLLCMTSKMNAQTIGDDFYNVKKMIPNGYIRGEDKKYGFCYQVDDSASSWAYIFNNQKECVMIGIYPHNRASLDDLCKSFDRDWEYFQERTWRATREDGVVIYVDLLFDDNIGFLFKVRTYETWLAERKFEE